MTQVLNKTSGPLCVTCYTSVNATVAGGVQLPYDLRNSKPVFSLCGSTE